MGIPAANRNHLELEELIGFFWTPWCCAPICRVLPPFASFCAGAEGHPRGLAHADVPFESWSRSSSPSAASIKTPLSGLPKLSEL